MASKVPRALVIEREVTVWRMVCQGRSQAAIAEALGITQPAVSQIQKRVSERVAKRFDAEVRCEKGVQLGRLEHVYDESMQAWESSKKPRKRSRSKKVTVGLSPQELANLPDGRPIPGGMSLPIREELLNEASIGDGNPAFLNVALEALTARRKILGIDAPKKLDLVDQRRPLEKLTDEGLLERAREADALLAAEGDGE